MRSRIPFAVVCGVIICAAVGIAQENARPTQQPAPPQQDIEKVVVGTNEVLLDAIVRDKKGRAIKDLQPTDFEVFEDGVRQEVKSFRLVSRPSVSTPNEQTSTDKKNEGAGRLSNIESSARAAGLNHIGTIAMVFDRLSPEARALARDAALSYLKPGLRADDAVGVFRIDLSLDAIQRFTNSENLVRRAIDQAVNRPPSTSTSVRDQIADLAERQAVLEDQVARNASTAGPNNDPGASIGGAAADAQFAQMTRNILEGFEHLEQNQQGFATTDGLLAIISEMGRLPGRKALIFFSEGVVLPTNVMANYRSVIGNANRANVSIYSVDAAGLRSVSADVGAGTAMTKLGQARTRVANSNSDPFGSMMRDMERNEELMRSNPDSALGDLADETGGFLISNTNDPGTKLRQVDEDLHSYYLLSYTPKNQNYDGKFRQIAIKVNRPGVDVQGRKGYYALDNSYGAPVLAYEAPALAILSNKPQPNAFPSAVAGFSFPETSRPGLVCALVEVPTGSVSFLTSEEKNAYTTNFSIVALIKDESQRVVRKLSNQYLLGGSLDKLASAKRGNVLFYKETMLDPGRYTIAAVVYDAISGHSSTSTSVFVVPNAPAGKMKLSSIVLVKTAERLSRDLQTANPFHFDEVLLYPNLGQPVRKSEVKDLALFITVYPPKDESSSPKLNLEISRDNKPVGQFSYDLPAADQNGRVQYVSAIPLEHLEPAEYEVKITVRGARDTVSRTERVQIIP